VSIDKNLVLGLAGSLEREAIRPNVLGRFSDMLLAVERHPAMLLYLDNHLSVGPHSKAARLLERRQNGRRIGINENLARETLELHTLGVGAGYTQSDVTIFCIGLSRAFQNFADTNGGMGSSRRMDYLQAENQLKTFSQETGGYSWFPQFAGEMPDVFRNVAAFLRHQYSLSYSPSNGAKDGKFHKLRVELVAPDGGPLTVMDQKGKKQKFQVYAREGYQAPKGGVGD